MAKRQDSQANNKNIPEIVEIDIRKILQQMGIAEEKWEDELERKESV